MLPVALGLAHVGICDLNRIGRNIPANGPPGSGRVSVSNLFFFCVRLKYLTNSAILTDFENLNINEILSCISKIEIIGK